MNEHYMMALKQKPKGWFEELWGRKVPFFGVFMTVLFFSYGFLYAIDFIPETPEGITAAAPEEVVEEEPVVKPETVDPLPQKISIPALNREVTIENPKTDDIATLDAALLKGVVRHPDSADFKNTGTMFLLGHSSYLPVIYNKNYQAFNGIQKLVWGDLIYLESGDEEYTYRVNRVYEAKASKAEVALQWEKPALTLVTCNSFGAKEDRFVVEAMFVESNKIGERAR